MERFTLEYELDNDRVSIERYREQGEPLRYAQYCEAFVTFMTAIGYPQIKQVFDKE